jgi:hypothetical protein
MNRAARRHLLAVLADNPVLVGYAPRAPRLSNAAESFLRTAGWEGWYLLPRGCVAFANRVRVVAGKGGRRRGVRDRVPPLRVYKAEGMSERMRLRKWRDRHKTGPWTALALPYVLKRFATRDQR